MTDGLSPLYIVPLFACFFVNLAARVCALKALSFKSASASELVSFVNGCEEITANILMLVTAVFGLHSLRTHSLQNLAEFERDVRGQRRELDRSASDHRKSAWKEVLTDGHLVCGRHILRSLFRVLVVAPMIHLVALVVYTGQRQWPPPSLGDMCGYLAAVVFGSDRQRVIDPYEVFLCFGYCLIIMQVSTAAIMGARVFHCACSRAIAAIVEELEQLCLEKYQAGKLGLVLVHHGKITEEMRCFWGPAEAGTSLAGAICVCFSFSAFSGLNLLILLAAPHAVSASSTANMVAPNVAGFFLGAILLLTLLLYLAAITTESTSTQPHAKSIVSAMRRYVTHCLTQDTEARLSIESTDNADDRDGIQLLSAADRNELLSAGMTVEARTVGVQLLGFLDMRFSLVIATFMRLLIYAPAGFSFLTTFLSHAHGGSRACQHCEQFNGSVLWNCTGCFVTSS